MNMIELVTKYLPVLDAQYALESRSAILDVAPEFVQMTRDAKKVKIAKLRVDGLANYGRNSGFTAGYADLTWEEHEFTQDRGRAIQIDVMDNEETFGLAFGRLAGEFQRLHVIPEIDAYRFAKYYQKAGTKVAVTLSANNIMSFVDDADSLMDDNEVPEENRILFVNPQVFKLMINDPAIDKFINVEGAEDKNINKKMYWYNNHRIIKVPSGRFYTAISLLSGSAGEEIGGFTPAAGAQVIGMLMVSTSAIVQLSKRRIARVWAPTKDMAAGTDGVNPYADAWKFDFRVYHDAWVLDEKIAGIYAATISGAGISVVDLVAGSYNSGTGTFTPGGVTYSVRDEGTTFVITGTIPLADADATLGLDAGNRVAFKLSNSAITAKSALPSGDIVESLYPDGTYHKYTKDAFESDGSLLVTYNADQLPVKIVRVTWVEGTTVTYVLDSTGAVLATA